jgi:Protein kinase domain
MRDLHEQGVTVVPPVVESGTDPSGRPFYVMPWYDEGSLEQAVSDRRFLSDRLGGLRLIGEIGAAVEVLHESGYAHRDLKPANVLVDQTRMILADLGLALALDLEGNERVTATDEAVGSHWYISPENESGISDDVDQRPADFYAFGKMLWALLTGRQPRAREQQLEPAFRLASLLGDPHLAPLDDVCEHLLRVDPRRRLVEWRVVQSELTIVIAALEGQPDTPSETPSDVERALAAARRYRTSDRARAADELEAARRTLDAEWRRLKAAADVEVQSFGPACNQLTEESGGHFQVFGGGQVIGLDQVMRALPPPLRSQLPPAGFDQAVLVKPWIASLQIDILRDATKPSLAIVGHIPMSGEHVWTLRMPYQISAGRIMAPPPLVERFGNVEGPYRIGLSAATEAARRLAHDVGTIGLAMVAEYLAHVESGVDVHAGATWRSFQDARRAPQAVVPLTAVLSAMDTERDRLAAADDFTDASDLVNAFERLVLEHVQAGRSREDIAVRLAATVEMVDTAERSGAEKVERFVADRPELFA